MVTLTLFLIGATPMITTDYCVNLQQEFMAPDKTIVYAYPTIHMYDLMTTPFLPSDTHVSISSLSKESTIEVNPQAGDTIQGLHRKVNLQSKNQSSDSPSKNHSDRMHVYGILEVKEV